MPFLTLTTNVSVAADKKEEVLKELSQVVGKLLKKPEMYMCVHISDNQSMTFGGTTDPAGFIKLTSIGGVGTSEQNNTISAEIFAIIENHLKIPGNRLYVEFSNIGPADIAFNGHTFA